MATAEFALWSEDWVWHTIFGPQRIWRGAPRPAARPRGKVGIDSNPDTPGQYSIRAIPTILSFKDGQVVDQLQGARAKADFEAAIEKLL